MIRDTILRWLIPILCSGAVSLAAAAFAQVLAIRAGVRCMLRAEIIRQYEKWVEDRGYCPIYAKEALSKAYAAYHKLGGNDVATDMYKSVMALPTEQRNEK